MPEHVRHRIYLVLTALAPLAIFYGLVVAEEAALWLAVAAAVLGGGTALAAVNTSSKRDDE